MNRYRITIKHTNGDETHINVAATNQAEAVARLSDPAIADKIAQMGEIDKLTIDYIGEYLPVSDNKERFTIAPSKERKGWWVAADVAHNLVLRFKEHELEQTKVFTPLDDTRPALDEATAIRELADWVRLYHSELATDDQAWLDAYHRQRIGAIIASARHDKGLTVAQLYEICDIDPAVIEAVERGVEIPADEVTAIGRALGLEI